ncbi:hypothetical protein [Streptomyces sp. NPDC093589]|uniref:hypothetical protein n=1 Tax=Streptomyces sp. NPDC093589 TaxID=3366043 RepID=UPI003808C518
MEAEQRLMAYLQKAGLGTARAHANLDAYTAQILIGAAAKFEAACPDGSGENVSMVCHCDAADLLRRMAAEAQRTP